MDTQLHLIDPPAPRSADDGPAPDPTPAPSPAGPRRAARPAPRSAPRPARSPRPWQLDDQVRALGLRGVAEAREALAAARRRPTGDEPHGHDAHHPSAA